MQHNISGFLFKSGKNKILISQLARLPISKSLSYRATMPQTHFFFQCTTKSQHNFSICVCLSV